MYVVEIVESVDGADKASLPDVMSNLAAKDIKDLPPGGGLWSK